MIILGLTGSIGMGKSTTANMFRDENIPVHDADSVVHDLYRNEAVKPIARLFPSAVINGAVKRTALGEIVLADQHKMRQLEELIHPMVHEKEQQFLQKSKSENAKLVVLDIPLLLETSGQLRVDAVLVVTAQADEQKRRVMARQGMSEEKFAAILKKQMPDAQKRKKADFIIDTSLGKNYARKKVREIIDQLYSTDKALKC